MAISNFNTRKGTLYLNGPLRLKYSLQAQNNGVFGTTGQVVPTSGQVVETTCECSAVSTTDFYQLGGSVQGPFHGIVLVK